MGYNIQLGRYYSRFSQYTEYADYKKLLFRAGDALQSAEVNEIQDTLHAETTTFANKFLANGEMLEGGDVLVTRSNKTETDGIITYDFKYACNSGVAYVSTYFLNIPALDLFMNNTEQVDANGSLGIIVKYEEVTDSEDITLRDPAIETRNYQQPGAARLKVTGKWSLESDFVDDGTNEFIPLFSIEHGEIKSIIGTVKWDDAMVDISAKYDRNANGNYVVEGYEASYLKKENNNNLGGFICNIADGSANVYGYNYENEISQTLTLAPLVDFELKQSEPFTFTEDKYYTPRHMPVRKVMRISGQKRINNEMITHGSFSGASDEIGNGTPLTQPIIKIFTVNDQSDGSGREYVQGVDFTQSGDSIAWVPAGSDTPVTDSHPDGETYEPQPGATYFVSYNYQHTLSVGDLEATATVSGTSGFINGDLHSIYLEGYDPSTTVSVDYDFVLQRSDAIYLNAKGKLGSIKGIPKEDDPRTPSIDNKGTILSLASVLLGADFDPIVTQDKQRVFKMADIQMLLEAIRDNEYNISRLALTNNLKENQPSAVFNNTFLDDFADDDLRDKGYTDGEQNALTVDGNLVLDINWNNIQVDIPVHAEQDAIEIPSTFTGTILQQRYYTRTRKINAYLFQAAPEAKLSITPKIYRWVSKTNYTTYVRSVQTSTRNIWTTRWGWWGWRRTTTSVSRQVLGSSKRRSSSISTSRTPEIIPRINIRLSSEDQDFNSGELVDIFFADTFVKSMTADSNGKINDTFQIPSNQFSGMKEVSVKGKESGVTGNTLFQAQPLVRNIHTTITSWWRWVVRRQTYIWWWRDPVAQSFVIKETSAIDSISVYFDVLPTTNTSVVITETTAGMPDKTKAVGSVTLTPAELRLAGSNNTATDFVFKTKPTLIKDTEYAFIVICDDAIGTVRCATLGERDKSGSGRWLTSQAYSVGAMFTSSNNSAWTPIQKDDMQFKINTCNYNAEYKVETPVITGVSNATDLMVLANAKIEEGTAVEYKVTLLDRALNNEFLVNSYSQFPLTTLYSGDVKIEATLKSTGDYSPKLDPSIQLSVGKTERTSTYVSRSFDFDEEGTIVDVYLDMYKPSNTNISVFYQSHEGDSHASDVWVSIPASETAKQLGGGWVEQHYTITDISEPTNAAGNPSGRTRIKIVLTTTNDSDRPVAGNLRTTIQKL